MEKLHIKFFFFFKYTCLCIPDEILPEFWLTELFQACMVLRGATAGVLDAVQGAVLVAVPQRKLLQGSIAAEPAARILSRTSWHRMSQTADLLRVWTCMVGYVSIRTSLYLLLFCTLLQTVNLERVFYI